MRSAGHPAGRGGRRLRLSLVVFLSLIGLMLILAAIKLAGPYATARRQEQELAQLRAQKRALIAERRGLREFQGKLATDAGQEMAARRQGYVRPGERRIVFVRGANEVAAEEPASKAAGNER